jgi:ABC-type proline/glycine betaine transport system ATPase subunit
VLGVSVTNGKRVLAVNEVFYKIDTGDIYVDIARCGSYKSTRLKIILLSEET